MGEKKLALGIVDPVEAVSGKLEEVLLLVEMGTEGEADEVLGDLEALQPVIQKEMDALDFRVMLGGPSDAANAFVQITAGAGGVDACDWASILLRLYVRWAERHEFDVEEVEIMEETEGGIRTATIRVEGAYAFGYLKAETGVHRIVRISPFDAQARQAHGVRVGERDARGRRLPRHRDQRGRHHRRHHARGRRPAAST